MGPKRAKKCVATGKDRVDREQQTKNQFDPLRLEAKYPGTAILLLQCEEKPILLAAAAALAKFAGKSVENLEVLFDLDIVDSVIPLITHEDLFTRRFATKLLAEMVAIPNVRNFLLESDYYIPHFTRVLINEKDLFMQEFSSLILSVISNDIYGAAQLLNQCSDMNFLYDRIQSPDPDVKKNTLEIIYNLLQDPVAAEHVIGAKNFDLKLVYALYDSPYPEIKKLALNVVRDLVRRNQDDSLQEHFRRTEGLQALLKFLNNVEYEDVHTDALEILRLACDNPSTVEYFDDIGGIKQILKYLEDASDPKLFKEALDVAVCLSHTSRGRKALYMYGIVDYLVQTLTGSVHPDIYETSCHGIGMMTLYNQAAKELTASNCVVKVLDVLRNENASWSARQAALFALNQLLRCDAKNCQEFMDLQGQNYLLWLLRQPEKVPIDILVGAVECIVTIARNQTFKDAIVTTDVLEALCASFELSCMSMTDFKIASCKALSVICVDKVGRLEFLRVSGPDRLSNLLCDVKSIPIRNAAAQLIQLLSTDPVLANAFVSARYIHYMLRNRSTARAVPSWDSCIEALFVAHLPIKFAFTGRLSLHDITKDGFYVLRKNVCQFPILDDIFRFKFCPREPIYVVNCIRPRRCSMDDELSSKLNIPNVRLASTESIIDKQRGAFLSTEIINLTIDSKFGRLPCDPHLYDYVELFKCKLIAAESQNIMSKTMQGVVNVNYVASRARMLAKFVVQQMSGPDPLIKCVDHQLEIHLKEIKESIETSVIPIGMLRVGSYFERALLFKVMADRIHLPTALVRGEYGKAWVEIAIPQTKSAAEEDIFHSYRHRSADCPDFITVYEPLQPIKQYIMERKSQIENSMSKDIIYDETSSSVFPTKLLKPNYIVDLMDYPGDLIPIGSRRAKMYCEKKLLCGFVCPKDTED